MSLYITLLTKNQSTSTRHRKKTAFNFLPRPSADARYSIPLCLCSQGIALWPYGDIQMGLVIEFKLKLTESGREYPKLNCQVSHFSPERCLIGVNSNDFFVVAVMLNAFNLHELEQCCKYKFCCYRLEIKERSHKYYPTIILSNILVTVSKHT